VLKRATSACLMLVSVVLLSLCLHGCSNGDPVQLLSANYFAYANGGYGSITHPYLCVNWQNQSGKTVDYMEVTVRFFDSKGSQMVADGKESFEIRLMEDSGAEPGKRNAQNITEVPIKFETEPSKLSLRINRISFADGTSWSSEDGKFSEFAVRKDSESEIPVVIDEVNFYKSSPQATARYINIDWHNQSSDVTTLAVEFKIIGHNTSSKATETEPVTYLTLSDRVSPGGENHEWKSQFSNDFSGDINEASDYEIVVHRVIDTDGNVWINEDDAGSVAATFVGRKGCAFGDYSQYPKVAELVKSIHASLTDSGTEINDPEVFVKPGSHCVIRYPDLDITVKLDETCSIKDDWVVFDFYYEATDANEETINSKGEAIGAAVFPAVLTSMDKDAVAKSWQDFFKSDASSPRFPDSEFQFEVDFGGIYKNYNDGTILGSMRICVAKDLAGAFDHDWAKQYPY